MQQLVPVKPVKQVIPPGAVIFLANFNSRNLRRENIIDLMKNLLCNLMQCLFLRQSRNKDIAKYDQSSDFRLS